jgi:UDPglucose--hexose-1-phosphate uridylyltransferase
MNATELNERERMVIENDSFVAYIPHFTDYPYGVFIVSRALKPHLAAFSLQEQSDLAQLLSALVRGMDAIYDRPFPYMMCLHQTPVNSPKYKDSEAYYAFHIEFYPPLRSAHKMKYYAGSEMGAGAAANPLAVEDCARILRDIIATQKV